MASSKSSKPHRFNIRWLLVFYDLCIFIAVCTLLFVVYEGMGSFTLSQMACQTLLAFICIFASRFAMNIYRQIWRYGGIQAYIKLLISDAVGTFFYCVFERLLPMPKKIALIHIVAICSMNLLIALAMRMTYRYAYKCATHNTLVGKILCKLVRVFAGTKVESESRTDVIKIKIAIVGAGRVGTDLAAELINNESSSYIPRCFIDVKREKIGRQIFGIPVFSEDNFSPEMFREYEVQEIVFALPHMPAEEMKALYDKYTKYGFKIKSYDYLNIQSAGTGKRHLREFDIEELLFRKPITVADEKTSAYYKGKTVLITGGGGSIGSELCRQIAKMDPARLVILDICENGEYDVQQELKITYGKKIDICVEIVSVCNRVGLERVFASHRPDIVLNAAAHKHVPLMERNCVEAVENNVFGTLNTVEMSEKYGVERVIMVSTDKAVNPTNVMGATKRMCEMIVQSHSTLGGKTTFSATRFGNVLGSAGSVIPLFKKQIAAGGPVTLTDKRIIRYFMTIPEASQLVLQSGAMAENGELFVLDMGKPIKILDLAENMIRLSGMEPYKDISIEEIGLRPGEKLYEELLVKTEELDKTEHSMIFVERDTPLPLDEINAKLDILREAVGTGDDDVVRNALKQVIPTYKSPDEVNVKAENTQEMKSVCV